MVGDHGSADMHCTNSQYKPPRPFFTSCTLSTSPRQSLVSLPQSSSPPISLTLPPQGIHQLPLTPEWELMTFIKFHFLSLTRSILQPNSHPTQPPQPTTNTTQNSPLPLTLSSSSYFANNTNVPINIAISTNFTHSANPRHSCIKLHSFHQLHLLY